MPEDWRSGNDPDYTEDFRSIAKRELKGENQKIVLTSLTEHAQQNGKDGSQSRLFHIISQLDLVSKSKFNYTICNKRNDRRSANQFGRIEYVELRSIHRCFLCLGRTVYF